MELDWDSEVYQKAHWTRRLQTFFVCPARYSLLHFPFFNKLLGTTWEFLTQPIRVTTSSASLIPSGFFLGSLLDTRESLSQARLRVRACLNSSSRREREVSRDNEVRFPRVSLDGPSTSIFERFEKLHMTWRAGSTGVQETKTMEYSQLVTAA